MALGKINVILTADSNGFSTGVNRANAELKNFDNITRESTSVAESFKQKLDEIKEISGRGSPLEETMKLLKGGGAVLGITEIGRSLDEVVTKAGELSKEFRAGQIDAMGVGVKLAESIPIIGNFVKAGQGIRELLTGEQAEIDKINESIKAQNEAWRNTRESHEKTMVTLKAMTEETKRLAVETRAAYLSITDPAGAKRLLLDFKIETNIGKINDELKKQIKEDNKELQENIDKARQERSAMFAERDALGPAVAAGKLDKDTDVGKNLIDKYDKLTATIKGLDAQIKSYGERIDKQTRDLTFGAKNEIMGNLQKETADRVAANAKIMEETWAKAKKDAESIFNAALKWQEKVEEQTKKSQAEQKKLLDENARLFGEVSKEQVHDLERFYDEQAKDSKQLQARDEKTQAEQLKQEDRRESNAAEVRSTPYAISSSLVNGGPIQKVAENTGKMVEAQGQTKKVMDDILKQLASSAISMFRP